MRSCCWTAESTYEAATGARRYEEYEMSFAAKVWHPRSTQTRLLSWRERVLHMPGSSSHPAAGELGRYTSTPGLDWRMRCAHPSLVHLASPDTVSVQALRPISATLVTFVTRLPAVAADSTGPTRFPAYLLTSLGVTQRTNTGETCPLQPRDGQ